MSTDEIGQGRDEGASVTVAPGPDTLPREGEGGERVRQKEECGRWWTPVEQTHEPMRRHFVQCCRPGVDRTVARVVVRVPDRDPSSTRFYSVCVSLDRTRKGVNHTVTTVAIHGLGWRFP